MFDSKSENRDRSVEAGESVSGESSLAAAKVRACQAATEAWRRRGELRGRRGDGASRSWV